MDTTGEIYLGIGIAAIVGALIGFFLLSRKGPRGAVLITGAILFFCGMSIPENNSRDLHLLEGILRLSGVIGGILGIFDLSRGKPTPTDDSES